MSLGSSRLGVWRCEKARHLRELCATWDGIKFIAEAAGDPRRHVVVAIVGIGQTAEGAIDDEVLPRIPQLIATTVAVGAPPYGA